MHSVLSSVLAFPDQTGREALARTIQELPGEQRAIVAETLDGLYFVDFKHIAPELLDVYAGRTTFRAQKLARRYDVPAHTLLGITILPRQDAFLNFESAWHYLRGQSGPLDIDQIQHAHALVMKGGIEGLKESDVGVFRNVGVIGNAVGDRSIDPLTLQQIRKSPYLDFELQDQVDQVVSGQILYPNEQSIKPEALERVRSVDPKLADELLAWRLDRELSKELKYTSGLVHLSDEDHSLVASLTPPGSREATPDELERLKEIQPELAQAQKAFQEKALPYLRNDAQFVASSLKRTLEKLGFPGPDQLTSRELHKLQADHGPLAAQVERYRALKKVAPDPATRTRRLVSALVDERLQWLIRQRNQIGPVDSPEKIQRMIELAADFQRDFISIHPFANGNGRTSRLVLAHLLEQENIPAPWLFDVDNDLHGTREAWVTEVNEGIEATQKLRQDWIDRIQLGLPLERSPELLAPAIVRRALIDQKTASHAKPIIDAEISEISNRQFLAWFERWLKADPYREMQFRSNPAQTLSQARQDFHSFNKSVQVRYIHPKDGSRKLALNFVDADYTSVFGVPFSKDPAKWHRKMEIWNMPEIVWRGLSYRTREVGQSEILDIFRKPHPQLVSNDIARHLGPGDAASQILQLVRTDFDRYNDDLFKGTLWEMAKDHSESGPRYESSYGYSTSKQESVGKAFSMGAMVIAPYGKQQEFQHLLTSRINIGMYRGIKDVDLGRLKAFEPSFSYKYGRQQEVMGIGAADPDAVMVVQKIDAQGNVAESYVRNPDQPSQIWQIRGHYLPEPGKTPNPDQLIATYDLWATGR